VNKVTVRINGQEYNMVGKEPKEYLLKVASYVDDKMQEVVEANPSLSTAMAAVLTTLNIADELFKCSYELDEVNTKYKKPLQDLQNANTTLIELQDNIGERDKKIEELEKELEKYKEELTSVKKEYEQRKSSFKEQEERLAESEEIANSFQNRLYDMQMKIVELEEKE